MENYDVTHPALERLVTEIADSLETIGEGKWTYQRGRVWWNAKIVHEDGNLTISFDGSELRFGDRHFTESSKLHIHGDYPRNMFGDSPSDYLKIGESFPKISVSAVKSADKIAKDIASRLLPDVSAMMMRVLTRNAQVKVWHFEKLAAMKMLVDFGGDTYPIDWNRTREMDYSVSSKPSYSSERPYWQATVETPSSVCIHVSNLTPGMAADLVRWIEERVKSGLKTPLKPDTEIPAE